MPVFVPFLVAAAGSMVGSWSAIEAYTRATGQIPPSDKAMELLLDSGLEKEAVKWVKKEIERRTGLALLDDEPFSDRSFAMAISNKIGFTIRSVLNKEMVIEDLMREASARLNEKTGLLIRDFRDKEMVREDVEQFAADQIFLRTGIRLHNLTDKQQITDDLMSFASQVVTERTGIPISNLGNVNAFKSDVYQWAESETRRRIGMPLADQTAPGTGLLKMDKRSVQNREAQRRFRKDLKEGRGKGRPVYINYKELDSFNAWRQAERAGANQPGPGGTGGSGQGGINGGVTSGNFSGGTSGGFMTDPNTATFGG